MGEPPNKAARRAPLSADTPVLAGMLMIGLGAFIAWSRLPSDSPLRVPLLCCAIGLIVVSSGLRIRHDRRNKNRIREVLRRSRHGGKAARQEVEAALRVRNFLRRRRTWRSAILRWILIGLFALAAGIFAFYALPPSSPLGGTILAAGILVFLGSACWRAYLSLHLLEVERREKAAGQSKHERRQEERRGTFMQAVFFAALVIAAVIWYLVDRTD